MSEEQALSVFELDKNVCREAVEKKYYILAKRYKSYADQDYEQYLHKTDILNKAYNTLMEKYNIIENRLFEINIPFIKRVIIDINKIENFFYYYKYIVIAVVCIFAFIFVRHYTRPDFIVLYNNCAKEYNISEYKGYIKKQIKSTVSSISKPGLIFYKPVNSYGILPGFIEQDKNAEHRKKTFSSADIFITPETTLSSMVNYGWIMPLDELLGEDLLAGIDKKMLVTVKRGDHIYAYGIKDVDSYLLKGILHMITPDKVVIAVSAKSKNIKEMKEFMIEIIKQMQKSQI